MEEGKRTVLVAALSAYAEQLANNKSRLNLEEGKGKSKASEDDVDLGLEARDQLTVIEELSTQLRERTVRLGSLDESLDLARFHDDLDTCSNKSTVPPRSSLKPTFFYDDGPVINPYTGLPVIQETGYEPGPSSRPPAPIRKPPSLPPNRPVRPPKPSHLRLSTSLARTLSLPPERQPPLPPLPPTYAESQTFERRKPTMMNTLDNGAAHMSDVWFQPLNTNAKASDKTAQPDRVPQILYSEVPSTASVPAPYTLDWETPKRDARERVSRSGSLFRNGSTARGSYMHHIADLASKALKAAGIRRTSSVSSSQSSYPRVVTDTSPQPTEITEDKIASRQASTRARFKLTQENLPSYVEPSHIRQKSSLASFSSYRGSSVFTPSPSSASQADPFSPASSSTSIIQDWSTAPIVASPSNFFPRQHKSSCWTPSPSINSMPEHKLPTPTPTPTPPYGMPDILTVDVLSPELPPQHSESVSATPPPPLEPRMSFLGRSRTLKINLPIFKRSSATSFSQDDTGYQQGLESIQDQHVDSYAWLDTPIEPQYASTSNKRNHFPSSPMTTREAKPSTSQQGLFELPSPPVPRRIPPSSNNPYKDHMAADESLAKTLQAEEFKDAQMERDRYLAYSLAHGMADDEDVELAYFMARQTDNLIATTANITKPFSATEPPKLRPRKSSKSPAVAPPFEETIVAPLPLDHDTVQLQQDLLKARELEQQLQAKSSIEEASLDEARRLQAEFDQQAENEDAWEEYKKSNIEECLICGDEQHREELLRPCKHGWCEGCLQDGFKNALSSRTPLKCCEGVLRVQHCTGLGDKFATEYGELILELSTQNPIYCSNAHCAKFLSPSSIIGDVGTCKTCNMQTCRHCKKKLHPGTFCEEDQETMAVKELGKAKGWKTCPGCNHLIERQSGCLHMVCTRCQTAFCYRCSKPWKDCESTCPDVISALHPKV